MADRKLLTAAEVAKKQGEEGSVLARGDLYGLILKVYPSGSKSWVWRGTVAGKRIYRGLGPVRLMGLAKARETALEYQKLARQGIDPHQAQPTDAPTFAEVASEFRTRQAWASGGSMAKAWEASLRLYILPDLGALQVDAITPQDIQRVLLRNGFWTHKPTAANRVRKLLARVLKFARAMKYTDGPNPAGNGILEVLPRQGKRTISAKALDPHQVAGAIRSVHQAARAWAGTKMAFEFLVLTAVRAAEVRSAKWSDVDMVSGTWRIRASDKKERRGHRVPLSGRALAVLQEARQLSDGPLVFPSPSGKVLSEATLRRLLKGRGVKATPHGFRSSFSTWCQEAGVEPELAELALAHKLKGVRAVYARSDRLAQRRPLMQAWADYLEG